MSNKTQLETKLALQSPITVLIIINLILNVSHRFAKQAGPCYNEHNGKNSEG